MAAPSELRHLSFWLHIWFRPPSNAPAFSGCWETPAASVGTCTAQQPAAGSRYRTRNLDWDVDVISQHPCNILPLDSANNC
jgi:hypothetical protein